MIREIVQINSFSTFIIGIILNTLLIVLVLNKSSPEMKIFTFDGDVNIVVLNSPFNANLIPKDVLLAIWDNCLLFSIFSQSAQFIYRYLSLNRNSNITSFQYFFSMFGIVLPLNFILSFLLYITGKAEKNVQFCCNNRALIEILERNGTIIEPILLAQKGNTLIYSFVWLLISILVLFAYLIMLVSARAMSLHVRLKLKVDTDRFTEINQQLTLNIIAYLMLIRLPIPWIAIFNPIVTILTLRHYRKAFISLIFNSSGSDSVVPLNTFTVSIQRNNTNNNTITR
uniref:G_PROTEIN_RECEP_F1_2 domain-containing protein n=1 Tax=Meloidogyne floridensis TaxID=298350 RepID=A0A915P819_9BILA